MLRPRLVGSLAPLHARARSRALRPLALAWLLASSLQVGTALADAGLAISPDAGSPEQQARRAQPVVKGTGFEITIGQIEDYIAKLPPPLRARYLTLEQRKELLASLLRVELLAYEAEQRGLGNNAAVRRTVKDNAVQALMRTEVDEKLSAESIAKAEIATFYEQNPHEFHHPAQRRASQILLATLEEATALLPEARKADLRAFGELARKHSLDGETKLRGGDLAFFTAEPSPEDAGRKTDAAIRKATFELAAVGETVSKPVPVNGQFAIVRLTGERPERHVTLAEAEGSIRGKLWREGRQKAVAALIDGLRARDKPKVFTERVDLVKFDDMDRRPPGFMPDPPPADGGAKPPKPN